MTEEQGKKLLNLARQTLEGELSNPKRTTLLPRNFSEKGATFVTLTKNGQLRGCIGCLEAFESIGQNIIRNVQAAAFDDHRFPPVSDAEIKDIKIEISLLNPKEEITYQNSDDLLTKITPFKDGIVLEASKNQTATFLPQVWEDLSDKEVFLSALCEKAGLPANSWRDQKLKVYKYQVQKFSE